MDKFLKVALILTAVDNMSKVVGGAASESAKKLQSIQSSAAKASQLIAAGEQGLKQLENFSDAFGEMQEAQQRLRVAMMGPGGFMDEDKFKRISDLTQTLSNKYSGSLAQYLDMVAVMKENRIDETDILGGIGESVAKLGELFRVPPAEIGQFAARLRNDMKVIPEDMGQMVDLVARLKNAGVGKTGSEAVQEMTEFYGKGGIGASNLGFFGVDAAKQLGALGGMFISKGVGGGQTVGTNFRRIFDGLRNADKLAKVNTVASQYGISLDFYKDGKFLGLENFVKQLTKLSNLSPTAIGGVLEPFSGKQGLSTEFLDYLAKFGGTEYQEYMTKLNGQANLDEKMTELLKSMNIQATITKTNWENAKAAMAASYAPIQTKIYEALGKVFVKIQELAKAHPIIFKFVAIFIAVASVATILAGVIIGLTVVWGILSLAFTASPLGWVVLVIAAVIAAFVALYLYWDKIAAFAKVLWAKIVNFFSAGLEAVKQLFFKYTLLGIIISHWDQILAFFGKLKTKFFDAGKNIIKSVADGIKAFIHHPIEMIAKMTEKMRAFLPFSPAKEGAFRDLHKVKIVETIVASMNASPLVNAMRNVTQMAFGAIERPNFGGGAVAGGAGAGFSFTYSPVISMPAGAGSMDLAAVLKQNSSEIIRLIHDELERKERRRF